MHLSSHTTAPIGAQRVARRTARGPRRRRAPDTPCRTDRKRSRHRLCVSRCAGKLPRRCSLRAPSRTAARHAAPSTRATAARHEPPARGHRSWRSGASMGPIGATSGAASRPPCDCPSMPRVAGPRRRRSCMHNGSGRERYRAAAVSRGELARWNGVHPGVARSGRVFRLNPRFRFSAGGAATGMLASPVLLSPGEPFQSRPQGSKWDTTAADLPWIEDISVMQVMGLCDPQRGAG